MMKGRESTMTDETNMNEETVMEKPSIFGMIMNPVIQFKRIKNNPKALVAMIVVTLFSALGMFMMTQGVDYTQQPGMGAMDENELMIVTTVANATVVIIGLFTPIFSILVSSAIYLAVAKIAHRDVTFKQLFSMNTYIFVISTISMLVNGLAIMLVGGASDTDTLFTSVNSIVGAEGALGGLLNNIEVFTIWDIIITALGLQVIAKFSKGLSWGIVLGIFVIMTGFTMLTSGAASMVGV